MEKIACTCSKNAHFDCHELATDLTVRRCPECQTILLAMKDYQPWLERHFSDRPTVEPASLPGRETPSKARLCPSCQRIMERYRTGDANSFWLDYCPACGLAWLDAGEWEQLETSGLAPYLDIILTERWQKSIQSQKANAIRDSLLRERLGEASFPEIQRIRDWLGQQPNKRDILAYLSASVSGKNAK
jgi:Zn-finger nucleic acid-binding protein